MSHFMNNARQGDLLIDELLANLTLDEKVAVLAGKYQRISRRENLGFPLTLRKQARTFGTRHHSLLMVYHLSASQMDRMASAAQGSLTVYDLRVFLVERHWVLHLIRT